METVFTASTHETNLKTKVCATELLSEFHRYANQIKILSLDCFDTLLWRNVANPKDVFYSLAESPAFKDFGFNALMRINGEKLAYKISRVKYGTKQAKLHDIYRASFPKINNEQLHALTQDELNAEAEVCFSFPPVMELILAAQARGIKVIIVSDTYLDVSQLRHLLAQKLPENVLNAIDKIYCSCESGEGKSEGLFKRIITEQQIAPQSVLHIGDNYIADVESPRKLGVNALHFIHHAEIMTELMRMQEAASGFIDPAIRSSRPLTSPHHALLANGIALEKPESIIGYSTIGPIMYAFSKFICNEVEQMQHAGKRVKVLFLMRDAYLPWRACEAYSGKSVGKCVRISRFASYAASFRNKEDVDRYLAATVQSLQFDSMCKQLLLPDDVATSIIKKIQQSKTPGNDFIEAIHREEILNIIFEQSKAYFLRLRRYLEKEVDVKEGDTLVFVDLGYTGTAQIKLEPIFKEEMNVDIIGRYLIALRAPDWENTRKGLFDPNVYDDKTLILLVTYIAMFEQMCTSSETSVVDFDKNGNPVFSETSVSKKQHEMLEAIQSECVRFIHEAKEFFTSVNINVSQQMLRDAAAINLCRFIYLPTKIELDYLQAFQFDFNLGTKEIIPLFDLEKGLVSLRKRSWLYCIKENLKNMRTNYPAEWRSTNLELAITLMAQHKFEFEFTINDLSHRRENIEIVIMHGKNAAQMVLEATLTHDGYYSLLVPVAKGNVQVGIRFGAKYRWVQIESVELIDMEALFKQVETEHTEDASQGVLLDQMQDKGGGLFECQSDLGLLICLVPSKVDSDYVLRVVFRPTVTRDGG